MSFDGSSPYVNSSDDRKMRQINRVRKKMQQRQPQDDHHLSSKIGEGGDGRNGRSADGENDQKDSTECLIKCLSSVPLPKIMNIESRSIKIQLSAPSWEGLPSEEDLGECHYELLLSDKGKDAKYKTVFSGVATDITLNDLKPGVEYYLRLCASLSNDVSGSVTDAVSFRTVASVPDCPLSPKLMNRAKTSLALKWNAAVENGSKISTYSLEWDQGEGGSSFVEVYNGSTRQYKATQLSPSTCYVFRLAAINAVGKSDWSETVSFYTSGSVPNPPLPPSLREQSVHDMTLTWGSRPCDDEFLLQMEDESTGHGFIPAYNGPNTFYTLKQLRRNTTYKFRLAAKNEEGASKWSEIVMYTTSPDKPSAPKRPQIVGKVTPHSFRMNWEAPSDDGGAEITSFIVQMDSGKGYTVVYEGGETERQFDSLTPGRQYLIRVACCSVGGTSHFSEGSTVTTPPVVPMSCPPPKLQGKPKASSLHIRWAQPSFDGGSPVTQYAAQMTSPDGSVREVFRGPGQDCVVAGLLPGRAYRFQVRAFNKIGGGVWSDPLDVVSGAGVPDAPSTPYVKCHSPHSALITWQEPHNNGAGITEYHLDWSQDSDTDAFSQLYAGPNLSYEVKGLTPATTYAFRLQALNSAGASQYSPIITCTTPPSTPGVVTLGQCQTTSTTLHLTWRPPTCNGSEVVAYNIVVSDREVLKVGAVEEWVIEDLMPNCVYKVRIQAINSLGAGPYSSVTKVTTRPLPPDPPRLECVSAIHNSLKLKWGDGRNTILLNYSLEMEKDGSFQAVYSGTAHTHKVTRLTECTSYGFRICASNEAGQGDYSDTVVFTTARSPPPTPKVEVRDVGQTACEVTWTIGHIATSDPVTFVLQLQPISGDQHTFKEVYKGPQTHFTLHKLKPGTDYKLRAYAIRKTTDKSSSDLPGPFSPITIFTTPSQHPRQTAAGKDNSKECSSSVAKEEKRAWTDQQWAGFILLMFVVMAVVVAFVAQRLMGYLSENSDVAT